jgi:hypothetical protein
MIRQALLTKEDIRKFIFDAISEYGTNQILNRADFCNYFHISFYQLDKYLDMGLPWIGKPTRKKFNVNECRKWLDEHTREL